MNLNSLRSDTQLLRRKGRLMEIIDKLLGRLGFSGRPPIEIGEDVSRHFSDCIEKWAQIYNGGGSWRYVKKGGMCDGYRKVASLNCAKALCMELSALCFSQQTDIRYKSLDTQRLVCKVLQNNEFWSCFPLFLEKVFALGGGVIKTYVEGGKVRLDYLGADCFIPTQYDEKGVYGGIAVSSTRNGDVQYLLLEKHERTPLGYEISNCLFKKRDRDSQFRQTELCELYPSLEPKIFVRGLEKPLFVYFRTASASTDGTPLGASVFACATDTLEALDVVFDSLKREFILGKKRIIVPVSALRSVFDSDGRERRYFNTQDEVYEAFTPDDKEELKIHDNSAQLRVTEHIDALEQLLDLLCMQTGLSAGSLSYHTNTARTATEVVSRNDKTFRTKTSHQQLIREGLIALTHNIVLLLAELGEIAPEALDEEASVVFSDSVSRDNTAKIDTALRLLDAGLIEKKDAAAAIFGIDEQEVVERGE